MQHVAINSKAYCCCLLLPRHLCHSTVYSSITRTSFRAVSKRRKEKKVCEDPSEEQVMTNIGATKEVWTLEGRGSYAVKHAHENLEHLVMAEDPEHLEMTAL